MEKARQQYCSAKRHYSLNFHDRRSDSQVILMKAGLTLIELLVVITIALIMMATVLANLPAFRSKTELDLIAQEVAITIRQAQAFGISARGSTGSDLAEGSYGIYLDRTTMPTSFILFADRDNNSEYNTLACNTPTTECVEKFDFRGGIIVAGIKGNKTGA